MNCERAMTGMCLTRFPAPPLFPPLLSTAWVSPLKFKIILYLGMAVVEEDVETQRKGSVGVFYQSNPMTKVLSSGEERDMFRRLLSCLPMRYSGCHVCLPNSPLFSFVKAVGLAAVGPAIRARTRFHKGEGKFVNNVCSSYTVNVLRGAFSALNLTKRRRRKICPMPLSDVSGSTQA
jgi:hypothetical protein